MDKHNAQIYVSTHLVSHGHIFMFFPMPQAEKQPSQISMKKSRSKGSKDKMSQEKVVAQQEPTKERSSVSEAIPEQKPTEREGTKGKERVTEKGIEGEEVADEEKNGEVTSKKTLDQKGSESFDVVSRLLCCC